MLATKAARKVYDAAGNLQGTVRMDSSEDCECDEVKNMSTTEIKLLTKGTMVKMLRRHAGLEHDVRGNGTCWLYAAMAAMGICEHAFTSGTGRVVTPLDIRLSESLLKAMRRHFLTLTEPTKPGRHQRDASRFDDYHKIKEQLGKMNVWVPSMGRDLAEFGSETMLTLLARTLERSIIVLDGDTMAKHRARPGEAGLHREETVHQVHDPQSKRLWRRQANTIGALIHLETHEDSLVLVHVNGNHYHAFAHKDVAPDRAPAFVRSMVAKDKDALASRRAHHLAAINPRLDPNHRP